MFAYCLNNPVRLVDYVGRRPADACTKAFGGEGIWTEEYSPSPIKVFYNGIKEDIGNYDKTNENAEVVFSSNYFSCYKDVFVLKTPFDASFSLGFIGLSTKQQNVDTLHHEYGHIVQLENMGLGRYIVEVAIPSVTINILDRKGKLPYDYYSYPWEAEANKLGKSSLSQGGKPPLPEGGYTSYWDLIPLFFD